MKRTLLFMLTLCAGLFEAGVGVARADNRAYYDYGIGVPQTFSAEVNSVRNSTRVMDLLEREYRDVMKPACDTLAQRINAANRVSNTNLRRTRLTFRIEALQASVGRDASGLYTGCANVTFVCVNR